MEILSDTTFKGSIKIYDSGGGSSHYGHVLSTGNCTLYLKGNGSEDNINFQIGPDSNNIRFDLNRSDLASSSRSAISVNAIRFTDATGVNDPVKIEYETTCGAIHIGNDFLVYPNGSAYAYGVFYVCGNLDVSNQLTLNNCSLSDWSNLENILSFAKLSDIPSLSGYLTTSAASSTYLSKTDASTTYQKKFTTFSSPSIPANCTAFEFTGTAISDSNKTHLIQVQNTSTGKSVIAETWMTTNKKPAMAFAGCTCTVAAGTYTAIVL